MKPRAVLLGSIATCLAAAAWLSVVTAASSTSHGPRVVAPVTFSESIAPIVYDNCVTCHRPGEAAPFSLISYEDVSKRAKMIATVTESRYMPPWHATPATSGSARWSPATATGRPLCWPRWRAASMS
jgi:hypothetical protein